MNHKSEAVNRAVKARRIYAAIKHASQILQKDPLVVVGNLNQEERDELCRRLGYKPTSELTWQIVEAFFKEDEDV